MLAAIAPQLANIACNRNGTYALQSIVEEISPGATRQVGMLQQALASDTLRVMNDDHGTHVVQRFLRRFPPAHCDFAFRVAATKCLQLAASSNTATVLTIIIDRAPAALRTQLIDEVVENAIYLSQHPYVVVWVMLLTRGMVGPWRVVMGGVDCLAVYPLASSHVWVPDSRVVSCVDLPVMWWVVCLLAWFGTAMETTWYNICWVAGRVARTVVMVTHTAPPPKATCIWAGHACVPGSVQRCAATLSLLPATSTAPT